MAKDQSFAAKFSRKADEHASQCPECGETYTFVKLVDTENGAKGSIRFREGMVGICKCNEKDVYAS